MGTTEALGVENGKMLLLSSSLTQASNWDLTKRNATLKDQLQDLQWRTMAHQEQIETQTEADLLMRQTEIAANDSHWFTADSLTDEFEDIKTRLPQPGDTLFVGKSLREGQAMHSMNGKALLSLQGDGNLVLYHVVGSLHCLWSPMKLGSKYAQLELSSDGDLKLLDKPDGSVLWSTGPQKGAVKVRLTDDCNLQLLSDSDATLWELGTYCNSLPIFLV